MWKNLTASNTAQLADIPSVNIKSFGALCNNLHDDSIAIQLAIASGANTIIIPKNTRIDTPIDCTDRANKPLTFKGQGWSQYGTDGTKIYCNTGGIAFDLTGSQYISFEDILLYSDVTMSAPSTIGILIARSATAGCGFAQFHDFRRLFINLISDPIATSRGTVGILNIGGEHFNFEHGYIIADLALAVMATNILNISSPYATFGAIASMLLANFKQVGFNSYSHSAVELWDAGIITFDNCYYTVMGINPTLAAITLNNGCNDVKINGLIENFPRALEIDGNAINITLDVVIDSVASVPYVFIREGMTLYNPKFSVYQIAGTQQDMIDLGDANITIYSGEIVLQPSQTLNLPTLKLYGTNVIAINVPLTDIILNALSEYSVNHSKIRKLFISATATYTIYLNGQGTQDFRVYYTAAAGTDQTFNLPVVYDNNVITVLGTPVGGSTLFVSSNGFTNSTVTLRCSTQNVDIHIHTTGY